MLASPEATPYDLRWTMFGIRVRVHPFFWVMSAVLGWRLIEVGTEYLLIWMACVFVSILWHELGHVLVGRMFGAPGHIVLWSFGGLAIGSSALDKRWQRILVYLAGPAFQLALFAVLWFFVSTEQDIHPAFGLDPHFQVAVSLLLQINLVWALFNLLPVFPLDGGQVMRDFLEGVAPNRGNRWAFQVGILVAGFIALHAVIAEIKHQQFIPYLPTDWYIAILFALLMVQNIQMMQAENQRSQWLDDRTPWDDPNW